MGNKWFFWNKWKLKENKIFWNINEWLSDSSKQVKVQEQIRVFRNCSSGTGNKQKLRNYRNLSSSTVQDVLEQVVFLEQQVLQEPVDFLFPQLFQEQSGSCRTSSSSEKGSGIVTSGFFWNYKSTGTSGVQEEQQEAQELLVYPIVLSSSLIVLMLRMCKLLHLHFDNGF